MKIPRAILLVTAVVSLTGVFIYDIIRKVVSDVNARGGELVHVILMFLGFGAVAAYFILRRRQAEINPVRTIGRVTLIGLGLLLLLGALSIPSFATFIFEDGRFIPKSYSTLMLASLLSVATGITSIVTFITLGDLIFLRRKRHTRRNYIILLVTGGIYILLAVVGTTGSDNDTLPSFLSPLFFTLGIIAILFNSFRLSWIVHLTRREKVYGMLFSLFGMIFFIMLTIFSYEHSNLLHQSLVYYHPSLHSFASLVFLFCAIFLGLTFTSTLFQLPTSEAFDRKKMEIRSLQNMSRLITEVFDYDELVATTIQLTLDVCEANAAWLKLLPYEHILPGKRVGSKPPQTKELHIPVVAARNTESFLVDQLILADGQAIESLVLDAKKPVIIHDFAADRRVQHLKQHRKQIGSLALVPLSSHNAIIGILGVIKQMPYGFDRDILNALLAFTDLVTIAIENNRLIGQSIEKERLEQELMVAQQMQQRLLPQHLPTASEFEMSAISLPAYEVGGDYYDVVELDRHRFGIAVGDVSGKGVSAALYMAQVKGIFQSLSPQSTSPRELLIRTNQALYGNMERRSFVSLLYAIADLESGTLSYSRAGHCPILYLRDGVPSYRRPGGMGLGLDNTGRFTESIEEETVELRTGDLIVLYTDGITEAKNGEGEEFGYQRLSDIVQRRQDDSCNSLMHEIIKEVKSFTGGGAAEDDITVLILRWRGRNDGGDGISEQVYHQMVES